MFTFNSVLCYRLSIVVNFKKYKSYISANTKILCDIFGIPSSKARAYINKHKLKYKEAALIMDSIKYCKKLGYSNKEILGTPQLLRVHPLELEQHYLSMEEGGFQSVGPKILARARYYMKREIKCLKDRKLICDSTEVPQNFLKYIEDKEIVKKIPKIDNSDCLRWNQVHFTILQAFLKWRLDATDEEIIKVFRIHRMVKNKSFRVIHENIALAEDLGFERRKILKYGYILHNYPTYPKTVLNDFPNLAGVDMRIAMRQYPKLMMTSPKNILKIYGILKQFDIADEVIRKQMNVFHMSPETVQLRLEGIQSSSDLRVLLKHPRILSLVVHHNRAKSRLSFLQQLQLKCASLIILGTGVNEDFDDYVREGKDINKDKDVVTFLKNIFNDTVEINIIKRKMKLHPYYRQVPIKDMQDSYDYLTKHKFQNHNIFKVMHVLLYPVEKLDKALNEMRTNEDFNYISLSQVKKLRLMLYFIEKEHHFTGNGIWRKYSTDLSDKTNE